MLSPPQRTTRCAKVATQSPALQISERLRVIPFDSGNRRITSMPENPDEMMMMMMTTTRMTRMTRGRKLLAQRGLAARDFALVAVSTTTTTTTSCLLEPPSPRGRVVFFSRGDARMTRRFVWVWGGNGRRGQYVQPRILNSIPISRTQENPNPQTNKTWWDPLPAFALKPTIV